MNMSRYPKDYPRKSRLYNPARTEGVGAPLPFHLKPDPSTLKRAYAPRHKANDIKTGPCFTRWLEYKGCAKSRLESYSYGAWGIDKSPRMVYTVWVNGDPWASFTNPTEAWLNKLTLSEIGKLRATVVQHAQF